MGSVETGKTVKYVFPSLNNLACRYGCANCGIVFDNWRVLHGRSSFTGKRRICGGYSEFSLIHSSGEIDAKRYS